MTRQHYPGYRLAAHTACPGAYAAVYATGGKSAAAAGAVTAAGRKLNAICPGAA